MSTALEASGVVWTIEGLQILRDVSLELVPGEICGLVGPNGSGKSSLLNVLSGVQPPTRGTLRVEGGADLAGAAPTAFQRAGVARTFQLLRLIEGETALNNVLVGSLHKAQDRNLPFAILPRWFSQASRRIRVEEARSCLERTGAGEFALFPVGGTSFGTRRKVELARAIVSRPKVLLLDEPTSGVSTVHVDEMLSLLLAESARGTAILLVDHDLEVIQRICHRVLVLEAGAIIYDGEPAAAFEDPEVKAAYIGS